MSEVRIGPDSVELDVTIAAQPETVFGLFTDPTGFAKWMGGGEGVATLEPKVGGTLHVEFAGGEVVVEGTVVEIDAPRRFVFSWGYVGGEPFPPGSSQVELVLSPIDEGTHLALRHTGLPSETAAKRHASGWRIYTSVLAANASATEFGGTVDDIANAWCEAWNTADEAKRLELLMRCTDDDVEFRHAFAALRGRDALSKHIVASRASMAGIRLEPTTSGLCHNYVRLGWQAVREGAVLATGENLGVLAPDGRLRLVAGFSDSPAST